VDADLIQGEEAEPGGGRASSAAAHHIRMSHDSTVVPQDILSSKPTWVTIGGPAVRSVLHLPGRWKLLRGDR